MQLVNNKCQKISFIINTGRFQIRKAVSAAGENFAWSWHMIVLLIDKSLGFLDNSTEDE